MHKRKSQQAVETSSTKILLKPVGKLLSQYNNSKTIKRSSFQPGRKKDHYQGQITPSLDNFAASFKYFGGNSCRRLKRQSDQPKQFKFNLIQDPRQSEFSYRKYLLIEKILFILTLFSLFVSAIGAEVRTFQSLEKNNPPDSSSIYDEHVDMLSSILTLLLIMSTLMRYVCLNQLQIDQKKFYYIRYNQGFLAELYRFFKQKQSVQIFLIQLIIIIPHPFFLFHHQTFRMFQSYDERYLNHRVNDLLALITLLRAYIIVRSIINLSIYSTPRASRLCSHNRVNHSILYTVKCLLRQKPVRIITLIFFVQLATLGFGLRLSEGSLCKDNQGYDCSPQTDFKNYINCYWNIFITMATVGYGDMYPRTLPGRIMAIMAAISGIILSSSLIVSTSAYLTMQANQTKSHLTLIRLQHQKLLKQQATEALIETMKMTKYLSSQQKQNDYKIKDIFTTIKHKIDLVKYRSRKIKSLVNNNNIMEEMNRLFQLFKDNLQQSFRNQLMLKQNLDNLNKTPNEQRKMKTMFLTHNMDQIMGNSKT